MRQTTKELIEEISNIIIVLQAKHLDKQAEYNLLHKTSLALIHRYKIKKRNINY